VVEDDHMIGLISIGDLMNLAARDQASALTLESSQ
jgi:hypothetical protein